MKLKRKLLKSRKIFRKIRRLFTIQFFVGFVLSALIILPFNITIQPPDPVFSNLDIDAMETQIDLINEISRLINLCMGEYDNMSSKSKTKGVIVCPEDQDNSD